MPDPRSDPQPDSHLTPAQDDAVRALLASARHTDPTPPDVVASLEATLASLGEERRAESETRAPVVTLASRRRRTAANLLLAAAAVVVAGVGIGQVLPSGSSDSGGSAGKSQESALSPESAESDRSFGAAEGEAGESGSGADGSGEAGAGESGAGADGDSKQGDTSSRAQGTAPSALGDVNALNSDDALLPQVRKLRRLTSATATSSADPACPLPDAGAGTNVPVTYDGLPGALIFRAPVGSTQQVDVFLCGESAALRSLRLRSP